MPRAITTPAVKPRTRECLECGGDLSGRHRAVKYCSAAHRDRFNNRERRRGAELHKLKMAERFERGHPKAKHLLSIMNRLCAQWRDEDFARRGGRRSWGDWEEFLDQNPWLLPGASRPIQDGIVFSSGTGLVRRNR